MLSLAPGQKILIAKDALNFQKGFHGTKIAARKLCSEQYLQGGVFVFSNRRRNMLRILTFDGHGDIMMTKLAAKGRFKWWDKNSTPQEVEKEVLHVLLMGGNPSTVNLPIPWKKIS